MSPAYVVIFGDQAPGFEKIEGNENVEKLKNFLNNSIMGLIVCRLR